MKKLVAPSYKKQDGKILLPPTDLMTEWHTLATAITIANEHDELEPDHNPNAEQDYVDIIRRIWNIEMCFGYTGWASIETVEIVTPLDAIVVNNW